MTCKFFDHDPSYYDSGCCDVCGTWYGDDVAFTSDTDGDLAPKPDPQEVSA